MHQYLSQITKAQEQERKRLARELHDEVVQRLILLSIEIENLSRKYRDSRQLVRSLKELRTKTITVMNEVRCISHELRPDILDRNGLVPSLELLAEELGHNANIKVHVETSNRNYTLSPDIELTLFRVTQEALNNVRRHSHATESIIQVRFSHRREIELRVSDNGCGFDVPEKLSDLASQDKLGIISMRERAILIGGTFHIESRLGQGTTVSVKVKAF